MNLTLDIGNTRSKAALFDGERLLKTEEFNQEKGENILSSFLKLYPKINNAIFSTVGPSPGIIESSSIKGVLLKLDHNTPLPIQNNYSTTDTLGPDRISNAVGAAHLFPNSNVLIIDAGTCITFDIINEEGQYLGGSISNGLQMRFRALNTFTENLPLLGHDNSENPDLIGDSTLNSIKSGVINGMFAELLGMIDGYNKQFNGLKILLTGGDSEYIEQRLNNQIDIKKNEIFANPNLVHIGLNAILNFYAESELH